jgi:hypothetical protein
MAGLVHVTLVPELYVAIVGALILIVPVLSTSMPEPTITAPAVAVVAAAPSELK